jgi:hypothetical protein
LRSGSRGPPPNVGQILLASKDVANVQRCWGRRENKLPKRGGMPTAKLGMPFHRHGFVTN